MSIFKETADENLIQGRHILDSEVPAEGSLLINPLDECSEFPKVSYRKDISSDETFKKFIVIPVRFSKLFLKIIPAYKANEKIEGIEDVIRIDYQGKTYRVQAYSRRNCKLPIKNKTKVVVIDETMPAIVVNCICQELSKMITEHKNGVIKTMVIGTSNDVSKGLYWKFNTPKKFKDGEFVSTYLANFLTYNDLTKMEFLAVASEGPLLLPKVSTDEISEMCDKITTTFKLDDEKSRQWKEDTLKMWDIMGGELVRSLYI
ncbi:uncharacterized protein HGUI_02711 [Hanseniaspora guilliermondii]|uniref:Proteasome assembly chaperone 1 n=1 Tax=Hanseniaspora guilliermondii TaxID=56406 RepID=A0A1L0D069_9ASCO|nr:uncharacterized protein HGUI_02711 [Hanseniaspora guilliermondii]